MSNPRPTDPVEGAGRLALGPSVRMCLDCAQSEAAHARDDMGTCGTFQPIEGEPLIRRLRVMACEALSSEGRALRSRKDAQVLLAAARLLEERGR
jgi:hypothetical protein